MRIRLGSQDEPQRASGATCFQICPWPPTPPLHTQPRPAAPTQCSPIPVWPLLTTDTTSLEFSYASLSSAKKPPVCPLCLRTAGLSRLGQSNRDMVPSPSHLSPLTHSDSSSGTKLYCTDGETEAQNRRVAQWAVAEPLDSQLCLRPALPCWAGLDTPPGGWISWLLMPEKAGRGIWGTSDSEDQLCLPGPRHYPHHLQVLERAACNLGCDGAPKGHQGPDRGRSGLDKGPFKPGLLRGGHPRPQGPQSSLLSHQRMPPSAYLALEKKKGSA